MTPQDAERDAMEMAEAAAMLAEGIPLQPMPVELQERVLRAGPRRRSGWALFGAAAAAILVMALAAGFWPRAVSGTTVAWAGEARGEVVWNGAEQKGLMRFVGMKRNDPRSSVYQLWIFDAERDERYPVDGGVFSIEREGEVTVPIVAKLPVRRAVLFAVTVEAPGGVVVSKREQIVATAKFGGD